MFLVAGLAVAVLVGVAAAFYFSIRSGNRGGKRLRPGTAARAGTGHAGTGHAGAGRDGADHAGAGRRPGSRSGSAGHGRTDNARRPAYGSGADYRDEDGIGADFAPDSGDPVLAGSRRLGYQSESDETQATDVDEDPARSRRRMGFRKGAHLDKELWPTETFGGVSDEQFWDDLAADKPLTTTARTAQQKPAARKQEPGTRKRPLDIAQDADPQAPRANGTGRAREDRAAREERGRDNGRPGAASGAYPESRTSPNPATERTMIQPAYAATQPAPTMAPQVPTMAPQVPGATQPTETRGRRRASSAEEDPLTSAAFALRASGPVDGRSSLRSGGSNSGDSWSGGSRSGGSQSGGDYTGTASYSPAGGSYSDPSPATPAKATPPHGENYGYGSRNAAHAGAGRDRPNGTRNRPRHTRTSEGTRSARQAYPQDSYPAGHRRGTGGYPADGYQANGYPGNGQRAVYDPRADYRRLTHRR